MCTKCQVIALTENGGGYKSKQIGDRVTVVTYDSKKHYDLRVQTLYINKKRSLATATNEQASVNTPKATSGTASKDIISQNNTKSNENSENNEVSTFSLSAPVEETKDLVAVIALTENGGGYKMNKKFYLGAEHFLW